MEKCKVLVTGVAGQLGHDVMNELAKRGYDGIGTDIADSYSGVRDNTAVVGMPYVQVDITESEAISYTVDGTPLNLSDKDKKWLGLKDTFKF